MIGDEELRMVERKIRETRILFLTAPPAYGKSTMIPRALVRMGFYPVYVLEPRRVVARSLAEYVRSVVRGEWGDDAVGHMVRYEHHPGRLITYATDGELPNILSLHPEMRGIGALVVDEAHERRIWQDVAIAMTVYWQNRGADVLLVVMSATMDVRSFSGRYPGSAWLDFGSGDAAGIAGQRIIRTPTGARVEVLHIYDPHSDSRGMSSLHSIPEAVGRVLEMMNSGHLRPGDILVFLPGMREIQEWASWARQEMPGWDVCRAHSLVPQEEMQRVFQDTGIPKIVFATNIFETALTIPNVSAVIDSGLERIDVHDRSTGITTLRTGWISLQSALQRAGRAGRVPGAGASSIDGAVVRLYSRERMEEMRPHRIPEIARQDISDILLFLRTYGIRMEDIREFLPDPPDEESITGAFRRLIRLGALDLFGNPTLLGFQMAAIPADVALSWMIARATGENRHDILDPLLMGLSVFSVTEGRLRFPEDHEDEWPDGPSPLREAFSIRSVEFGTEVAGYAMLLHFYRNRGNPEDDSARRNPMREDLLSVPEDMREWFWRENRMEEASRAYEQIRGIIGRFVTDVPVWDGDPEPLREMRGFLIMAMAERMYSLQVPGRFHRYVPVWWTLRPGESARLDLSGAFQVVGVLPKLVIPLGEIRVEGRRGDVILLTGVTGVRLPDDMKFLPEEVAGKIAGSDAFVSY